MSEHKIPIPSMLYNAAVGGHVTNSQQIIDENLNREQNDINQEIVGAVPYNASNPNGMGKIVLKKNDNFKQVIEAQTNGNTIFVIKYDFMLTDNVTIPANCILQFEGGSISAGSGENMNTIIGTNTYIQAGLFKIFNGVSFSGSFKNSIVYDSWFNVKNATNTADAIVDFYSHAVELRAHKLMFEKGSYLIDKEITLTSTTNDEWDIELCGAGGSMAENASNTTFYFTNANACIVVNPYHVQGGWKGVDFSNIKFSGYGYDALGSGLIIKNCQLSKITKCAFFYLNKGIALTGNSHYIHIEDCIFYSCEYGVYDIPSNSSYYEDGGSNEDIITRCLFDTCENPVMQNGSSFGWTFTDCDVEGNNGTILLDSGNICENLRIERNIKSKVWLKITGNKNKIKVAFSEAGGTYTTRLLVIGNYNDFDIIFGGFIPNALLDYGRYNKFNILDESLSNISSSYLFDITSDITFNGVNNKGGYQGKNLISSFTSATGGNLSNNNTYKGITSFYRSGSKTVGVSSQESNGNLYSTLVVAFIKNPDYEEQIKDPTIIINNSWAEAFNYYDYEDAGRIKIIVVKHPKTETPITSVSYSIWGSTNVPERLSAAIFFYTSCSENRPCFDCLEENSESINLVQHGKTNIVYLSTLELPASIKNIDNITSYNIDFIYNSKVYVWNGSALVLKQS